MSRRNRTKPQPTQQVEADAGDAEQLEDLEAPPATLLEQLAELELDRGSAIFLLGYARHTVHEDPIKLARELRGQPWLWAALRARNFVAFTRALGMCGRSEVTVLELQVAINAVDAELRVAPRAAATTGSEPLDPEFIAARANANAAPRNRPPAA